MKSNHNEIIKLVPSIKQPVLSNRETLKQQIIRHEGLMCGLYLRGDQVYIGVGRNLSVTGISEQEAHYLVTNDIKRLKPLLDRESLLEKEDMGASHQALPLATLIRHPQKVAYLFDTGMTYREALYFLNNDIKRIELSLAQSWPVFSLLLHQHQGVLINIAFDIGVTELLKLNCMLAALEQEAYEFAAIELSQSDWAKTVGDRAKELAAQLRMT